jgi:hypothetical protein
MHQAGGCIIPRSRQVPNSLEILLRFSLDSLAVLGRAFRFGGTCIVAALSIARSELDVAQRRGMETATTSAQAPAPKSERSRPAYVFDVRSRAVIYFSTRQFARSTVIWRTSTAPCRTKRLIWADSLRSTLGRGNCGRLCGCHGFHCSWRSLFCARAAARLTFGGLSTVRSSPSLWPPTRVFFRMLKDTIQGGSRSIIPGRRTSISAGGT